MQFILFFNTCRERSARFAAAEDWFKPPMIIIIGPILPEGTGDKLCLTNVILT